MIAILLATQCKQRILPGNEERTWTFVRDRHTAIQLTNRGQYDYNR